MNANQAFYFNNAAVQFRANGSTFRAFVMRGEVQVFGVYSQSRSFDPAAIREARRLLAA